MSIATNAHQFILNSEAKNDALTESPSAPTTLLAALNLKTSTAPNPDATTKLTALVDFFAKRGKDADGPVAMMFGMMPLIRLQLARTEPEAITAMAIFLSECMQRIGNPEVATDDMAKWLTELT